MHRRPLLDMLDRYARRYPAEAAVAARIGDLITAHADCFDRTCRPGHVTGSAWVVTADGSRTLLVHHRKLHKWLQPGGHADGDADVPRVALREAREESGLAALSLYGRDDLLPLDLDVHDIPARYNVAGELIEDAHQHHDCRFLVVSPTAAAPVVSDESHDVRWFRVEQLPQITQEESVLRLARKAAALLRGE